MSRAPWAVSAVVALGLVGALAWTLASPGPDRSGGMLVGDWAVRVLEPGGRAAYLMAHPDQVAIAAFVVDRAGGPHPYYPVLRHRADQPVPVGHLPDVALAATWAWRHGPGRDTWPPTDTAAWAAWWLPGTDAVAHQDARRAHDLPPPGAGPVDVPWETVASAVVTHGDRAAADLIAHTLGEEATAGWPGAEGQRLDLPAREGSHLATWLGVHHHGAPAPVAEDPAALAERHRTDAAWREAEIAFRSRADRALGPLDTVSPRLAEAGPRATADQLAGLAAHLVRRTWPEAAAADWVTTTCRRAPTVAAAEKDDFSRLCVIEAAWPGLVGTLAWGEPVDGAPPRVVALLVHDLPGPVWRSWASSHASFPLALAWLRDPSRLRVWSEKLSGAMPQGADKR